MLGVFLNKKKKIIILFWSPDISNLPMIIFTFQKPNINLIFPPSQIKKKTTIDPDINIHMFFRRFFIPVSYIYITLLEPSELSIIILQQTTLMTFYLKITLSSYSVNNNWGAYLGMKLIRAMYRRQSSLPIVVY